MEKRKGLCKSVMRFLFSNVGVCFIIIVYCVIGGLIFEHLEKNNEQQICYNTRDEYENMEKKTLLEVKKILKKYEGNPHTSVVMQEMTTLLQTFRNNCVAIGYAGDICGDYGKEGGPIYKWSVIGATYFSVTVISTIGKVGIIYMFK